MTKLFPTLVLGFSLAAAGGAIAHGGAAAKHGGIVQSASDLSFELVPQADGAILYVEDHGKPMATQGMSGKLTVLTGALKSEAELAPAGDNRLEAKGVRLSAGTKAVVALRTPAKKAVTVRFVMK